MLAPLPSSLPGVDIVNAVPAVSTGKVTIVLNAPPVSAGAPRTATWRGSSWGDYWKMASTQKFDAAKLAVGKPLDPIR